MEEERDAAMARLTKMEREALEEVSRCNIVCFTAGHELSLSVLSNLTLYIYIYLFLSVYTSTPSPSPSPSGRLVAREGGGNTTDNLAHAVGERRGERESEEEEDVCSLVS